MKRKKLNPNEKSEASQIEGWFGVIERTTRVGLAVCSSQIFCSNGWVQEWYTSRVPAQQRLANLRRLGYSVGMNDMGMQSTPKGDERMYMLTIKSSVLRPGMEDLPHINALEVFPK